MNAFVKSWATALLVGVMVGVSGCGGGGGVDENKPMGEVKADAEKMDVAALKKTAMAYKEAIQAKMATASDVAEKLKAIPLLDQMGEEAKTLQTEAKTIADSVKALSDRFTVYYDKLKELKGDLSGLEKP